MAVKRMAEAAVRASKWLWIRRQMSIWGKEVSKCIVIKVQVPVVIENVNLVLLLSFSILFVLSVAELQVRRSRVEQTKCFSWLKLV